MIKVWQCVSLLAVLWIGAVIGDGCLYQNQTWGDLNNPHIFYYCEKISNTSVKADCPADSGYVNNGTALGCIGWNLWNTTCVSQTPISLETCGVYSYRKPHGFGDPSFYYLCLEKDTIPVKVPCPDGNGFFSGKDYSGCFPWAMWRSISGCVN